MDNIEKRYRRATDEEKDAANVSEEYDLLIGLNGFECLLTEPEDRNWYRDGVSVISELNRIDSELTRANETVEIVAAQRDRALEAVEKLRAAVKLYNAFIPGEWPMPFGYGAIQGRLNEALAATEPATAALPKCDRCGAIACGTDCDGSSHYTAEKKE